MTDHTAKICHRDGDDVVAVDHAAVIEPVQRPDRDFSGQTSDSGGDRCHRHALQVWTDQFPGQDDHGPRLLKTSRVDRPHYSISMGRRAAYSAKRSKSGSGSAAARIAASLAAISRRNSLANARSIT